MSEIINENGTQENPTTQETVTPEVKTPEVDPRDARIAELEEKLKTKSIKERLSKKEAEPELTPDEKLMRRVTVAELKAEGLKDAEEIQLVIDKAKVLGLEPTDAYKDELVQGLIKRMRKQKEADTAIPAGSGRTTVNVKSTAEYWIKKGELPPKENVELRREVVNTRRERERRASKFNN